MTFDPAAARERCEKAKKGPWETTIAGVEGDNYCAGTGPWYRVRNGVGYAQAESDQAALDAAFIAHARTDLPAALDEIERLTKSRDNAVEMQAVMLGRDQMLVEGIRDRDDTIVFLRSEIELLTMDAAHWKANHDEMVERNRVLRERPDLPPEQVLPRLAILDQNEALRALAEAAPKWLPIETAPKVVDEDVLCFLKNGWCTVLSWDGESWVDAHLWQYKPTHWMPLPPAPQAGEVG